MRCFILLSLCLVFISCKEKLFTGDVNCSDCYTPKPDSAYMTIRFTINQDYKEVPFVVYRGDFEDNQIDWIDTSHTATKDVWVKADQKYSVKAKYHKGDKTLYAIDGGLIKVLLVTGACDQDCYVLKGETLNLEIRDIFLDY
jgi:hypothetical protein